MTSPHDEVIIFRNFQKTADISTSFAIIWILLLQLRESNQYYDSAKFYRHSKIVWLQIAILIFDDVISWTWQVLFQKTGSDVIWRHDVRLSQKFQELFLTLISCFSPSMKFISLVKRNLSSIINFPDLQRKSDTCHFDHPHNYRSTSHVELKFSKLA